MDPKVVPFNERDIALGSPSFDPESYAQSAQSYINRPNWKGTNVNGQMFANGAKAAYDKTGVLVPWDLALAQAQMETGMGTKTRSANNIFNVGETDQGGHIPYKDPQESINAYYDLMARKYYGEGKRSTNDLLNKFVNTDGQRYASNPNYEHMIRSQADYINKYVTKNGTR